jgi:hypothetical protein
MPNGLEMSRPASSSNPHYTRFFAAGRVGSIELLGSGGWSVVEVSSDHGQAEAPKICHEVAGHQRDESPFPDEVDARKKAEDKGEYQLVDEEDAMYEGEGYRREHDSGRLRAALSLQAIDKISPPNDLFAERGLQRNGKEEEEPLPDEQIA